MLSPERNKFIAKRLRVLGAPMRLRILQVLEDGEKPLDDIVGLLQVSRSKLSGHLRALCQAGVLDRRREGLSDHYRISDQTVLSLCDLIVQSVAKLKLPKSTQRHVYPDEGEGNKRLVTGTAALKQTRDGLRN